MCVISVSWRILFFGGELRVIGGWGQELLCKRSEQFFFREGAVFNTCCGIAPLAHNLPNCRTVRNLSGPSWRVAVNIVFLEVFLFVIASPGIRHTGLSIIDIPVSHFVVVCTWLTHVTTRANQEPAYF